MEQKIKWVIKQVSVSAILDLRYRELREGRPKSEASFDGDNDPDTLHFAAFLENEQGIVADEPICCVSYMLNDWEGKPAYQLRGMATDRQFQKRGIGKALVIYAEKVIAAEKDIHLFWCKARASAVEFYKKMGWLVMSDAFDVPTVGPHYKMMCALK